MNALIALLFIFICWTPLFWCLLDKEHNVFHLIAVELFLLAIMALMI